MKYLFKNLILRDGVVPQTANSHQGEKYSWITADLFNEADPFGNPSRLPRYYIMETNMVELYRAYCEPVPGQANTYKVNEKSLKEAIAKGEVADILHISNVFMVEVPLTEAYVRLDRITQQPVVNKNGVSIPTQTLTLYLKKTIDTDTNETTWVESPSRVAERVLNRSYVPYTKLAAAPQGASQATAAPQAEQQETPEQALARKRAELEAMEKALG